jgi:hypothetical protein
VIRVMGLNGDAFDYVNTIIEKSSSVKKSFQPQVKTDSVSHRQKRVARLLASRATPFHYSRRHYGIIALRIPDQGPLRPRVSSQRKQK